MSIDYNSLLTSEQKKQILEARISQFASEAYQVSLNLTTAEKLGNPEQIEKIKNSLQLLEIAITVHQEELKLIP
jgi:hypothetical protein